MKKIKETIKEIALATLVSIILVAVIFISIIAYIRNMYAFTDSYYEVVEYEVENGDTLWAIGKENIAGKDNVKAWVEEVKALNNMESDMLHPGQTISIYSEN